MNSAVSFVCVIFLVMTRFGSSEPVPGECPADVGCPPVTPSQLKIPTPVVDPATVPAQLVDLAKLSDSELSAGVTRLIFTDSDMAGRALLSLRSWCVSLALRLFLLSVLQWLCPV